MKKQDVLCVLSMSEARILSPCTIKSHLYVGITVPTILSLWRVSLDTCVK